MAKNSNWGGKRQGSGRPRQYIKVPVNFGRGHDEELAPAQRLSPDYPQDPSDIVLAKNSDGRYGVYIEDDWYGAAQALVILEYLEQHRGWLEQKVRESK